MRISRGAQPQTKNGESKRGEVEMERNRLERIFEKWQSESLPLELDAFLQDLKEYRGRLEYLNASKTTLGHEIRERDELKEKLVRKTGMLKSVIIELTNKQYMTLHENSYEIWSEAFNQVDFSLPQRQLSALTFCIDAVNEAIGKLESDIKLGVRDKQGNLIKTEKILSTSEESPVDKGEKSTYQKIWQWIDTHRVLSILGAIAAIATIVSVIIGLT